MKDGEKADINNTDTSPTHRLQKKYTAQCELGTEKRSGHISQRSHIEVEHC